MFIKSYCKEKVSSFQQLSDSKMTSEGKLYVLGSVMSHKPKVDDEGLSSALRCQFSYAKYAIMCLLL